MATLVSFHAHPDDESIATGGTLAKAAARRAPHRARGRHQGRARRGGRRVPRRRRDPRRAPREGDGAVGGDPRRPAGRVAGLHRLRDDGHARERPRGLVLDRRRRRGRRAAGRDPPRRGRRRAHDLRQRRQLRPPRPHPGAPRRACGPPSWRARPGCSRARSTATTSSGRCWRPPRRASSPARTRRPRRLRDVRPARVDDHHHGRRARLPRAEAGVDGRARQPDRRLVVLPRHAARAVRGGFGQEWFIRHGVPEDHRDDDLFAGLE